MAELPLAREDKGLMKGAVYPREAMFYQGLPGRRVRCLLCNNRCEISRGNSGLCRSRINKEGSLRTFAFSNPCAVHVEAIEKEPMYHFLPGTTTLSIAVAGCNLCCNFCQNWLITQFSPLESMNYLRLPGDILDLALANSCSTIDFTYSEPVIFYEYMIEIAKLARSSGIKNICHTNAHIEKGPLRYLCKHLDGVCVDLKGFKEDFYRQNCKGSLSVVLDNMRIIRQEGLHLEIVNLVIPGLNDDLEVIRSMCEWIVKDMGPETPVHFLQFHPRYKLDDLDSTSPDALKKARDIARSSGLNFSYISNTLDYPDRDTVCPGCQRTLITRRGYSIEENDISDGRCKFCNKEIAGYWDA